MKGVYELHDSGCAAAKSEDYRRHLGEDETVAISQTMGGVISGGCIIDRLIGGKHCRSRGIY